MSEQMNKQMLSLLGALPAFQGSPSKYSEIFGCFVFLSKEKVLKQKIKYFQGFPAVVTFPLIDIELCAISHFHPGVIWNKKSGQTKNLTIKAFFYIYKSS